MGLPRLPPCSSSSGMLPWLFWESENSLFHFCIELPVPHHIRCGDIWGNHVSTLSSGQRSPRQGSPSSRGGEHYGNHFQGHNRKERRSVRGRGFFPLRSTLKGKFCAFTYILYFAHIVRIYVFPDSHKASGIFKNDVGRSNMPRNTTTSLFHELCCTIGQVAPQDC
jgi:hypothetical protein